MKSLGYSERRICRALGISRNSVRYEPQPRPDEAALTSSIVRLAGQYGRYGYRRIQFHHQKCFMAEPQSYVSIPKYNVLCRYL